MGRRGDGMTYNLYYCDDAERILKGSFETKEQAIKGFHDVCRNEFKFGAYGFDLVEDKNVTRIDYGGNKHWFEISDL